jgi:hypothetical protein
MDFDFFLEDAAGGGFEGFPVADEGSGKTPLVLAGGLETFDQQDKEPLLLWVNGKNHVIHTDFKLS